jgi:hypothetical protein
VLFYSEFFKEARYAKVKSPAEVVVGTMNLVGDFKGIPKPGLYDIGAEPTNMGQALLDPPSVEGWHTGTEWVTTGSLVNRVNFAAGEFSDPSRPGVRDIIERIRDQRAYTSPESLVDACLNLIGHVKVSDQTGQDLVAHASSLGDLDFGSDAAARTSAERITQLLQLIAATTEYQLA